MDRSNAQAPEIITYFNDKGEVVPKAQATQAEVRRGNRSSLVRLQRPVLQPVTKSEFSIRY